MKSDEVIKEVCSYYGVSIKEIKLPYQQQYPANVAQKMIIYMLHKDAGMRMADIAEYFGVVKRSIEYRYGQAQQYIHKSEMFKKEYNGILQTIKNQLL